ncbi:efflux RND transporter periplasmic adaptor subunit [Exilibacterium tricleocarpae]|uniref:Efflux RND transporter periplasmic adaptor subunit n=1 Tax=Exilibacterium tricleocarpae TaxID=2591008 RepID=A0A545U5R0_9GAMM|nr:efflux RND transporter periplasmic adaptor subunit [Exilibacterium tricleocarpae]TQV84808.1 efflux RND transporter periplasmic adaptor subunit [Exilibacterium tricleocarpae]
MILYSFSRIQMLLIAALIGLAGVILAALGEDPGEAVLAPYFHRVSPLVLSEQSSYQVERRFSGEVSARQHADMGFEQAGKLAEVLVDEGETLAEGDVLAVLDTELLRIERRELDAQLAETRAQLQLTEASLRRQRSLRQSGFTSEQRLDELDAERAALIASIARLDASVASVASRIRKSTLTAPFDGVVTRRFADQGVVLNAGVAVLRLQQQGAMEAHIGVPVRMLPILQPGDPSRIEVDGNTLAARVLAVGADVHAVTRTVMVRFRLPDDALVVNGDLAYLTLTETVDSPGFWVPAAAITDGIRGLWSVYLLAADENGTAGAGNAYRLESRDIQVIHANREQVFINGAVSSGEKLVAAGLHRLVPGQRVVLKRTADALAQE